MPIVRAWCQTPTVTADNKNTKEYIPQQQLGQIIITVLFISRLGLHSQARQSVYRLSKDWFHDTKLVEGFLGDGHMRRRCTDQPIQPPCVYNSTTIAVQQYTRKKQEQTSRDRGIWTNILGVRRKKKEKKTAQTGWGIWTDALLV